MSPEHFKSYIDAFKYGAPPHAGWSIGLDRLTMAVCGLKNIREAVMFPRDKQRLKP
jgi:aspartyl-tRNA synthetase